MCSCVYHEYTVNYNCVCVFIRSLLLLVSNRQYIL